MKKLSTKILAATFLSCLIFSTAQADNVATLLKSAEQNYTAKKYSKTLEDLEWARKEIVNLQLASMKDLLPAEINGMKAVDVDGDSAAAFGLRTISKQYKKANEDKSVTISILSGGNSSSAGGLGALMGMAASMGALQQGGAGSKIIIEKGYRGQFLQESGEQSGTLTFNLNDGKMITIETYGYDDSAMAEKVAQKLDISKIEAAF